MDYLIYHGTSVEFQESIDYGCMIALNDALVHASVQKYAFKVTHVRILSHSKLPSILIKGFTHPSLAVMLFIINSNE
jgi:hypothetical protein